MTRSKAGSIGQLILLAASLCQAKPFQQWRSRFFYLSLLTIFLCPVTSVIEPGAANAQSINNNARRASGQRLRRPGPRKRARLRVRTRRVAKPKKSFFGGLFGSKPSTGNSAKPFQGLKSFFDNIQGKPNPAALRASYEKRMRDAARKDTMSANKRLQLRPGGGASGWGADPTRTAATARQGWGRGQYRTMCVRMCDGYYFPVSFKARSGQLETDAQYCNSNCYNAPTKLFYYSNPGGSIENMRALDGSLYKDIANAFKYRKKYVADCRCKAEPWSKQAKQQHESWGLQAQTSHHEIEGEVNDSDKISSQKPVDEIDMTSASQLTIR